MPSYRDLWRCYCPISLPKPTLRFIPTPDAYKSALSLGSSKRRKRKEWSWRTKASLRGGMGLWDEKGPAIGWGWLLWILRYCVASSPLPYASEELFLWWWCRIESGEVSFTSEGVYGNSSHERDWGQCLAKGYGEEGTDFRNIILLFLLPSSDCRRNTCSLNYKIWKTTGNYTKGKSLSRNFNIWW